MRSAGILGRALVLSLGLSGFAGSVEPLPSEHAPNGGRETPSCVPRALCCKTCEQGKACGNSCISRSRACQREPGCACDADLICE